jgi:hypothetical protein
MKKTIVGVLAICTLFAACSATEPSEPSEPDQTPAEGTRDHEGAADSDGTWIMPDVVGADLQSAQDTVQAVTDYGVFYSDSQDLSGLDRMQVVDSNWQVCSQTPSAGDTLTSSSSVSFGVVKFGEYCP